MHFFTKRYHDHTVFESNRKGLVSEQSDLNDTRTIALLDCSNLGRGAQRLGGPFAYEELARILRPRTRVKCYLIEDDYQSSVHTMREHLKSLGFEVVTKDLKFYGNKASGNFDVEIALEMARIAQGFSETSRVILGSGDGDFVPAVRLLQSKNMAVWGLAFENSMSKELRATLDRYIPIGREWVRVPKAPRFSSWR